ncbi:MAG TPA: cation:proton antiporter [Sphingobium sp.]|nr:cation:proton antiporter [Sphingobium sp.]
MASELTESGFRDALVILGAAGLVIPTFARFRVSPVIGFILVGLAVGPSGLGALVHEMPALRWITITDPAGIAPFAEFGIVLLLFSIGLELSFARLWSMRRLVFGIGPAELFGCGLIIALGLYLAGERLTGAIGIGIALALSSTALILPMVGTRTPIGRAAFAMLLFEDIALVPIIFALGAMAPFVQDAGWSGFANTIILGLVTIAAMLVAGRYLLPPMFSQAARTKSPEVFLAASLLVVMLASLATSIAGLSAIVGALVAGMLIAETPYRGEVELVTAPFKGLALGVFLITVGMQIDVQQIAPMWPQLMGATLAVLLVKAVLTALLLNATGARRAVALEAGVLMSSPSETTLIVLGAATTAQLIAPDTAAFWQTATAIGLTITPLLARVGHDVARRIELRGADVGVPDETTETPPTAVILGFGRVGRMVADMLKTHNQPYVAVESDIDIVTEARRDGYIVMFGDAARPEQLDRLRLGHARALILTMDDPVLSVGITRRVRGWVPDLPIIVRARDADHAAELYRAGANDAVPETLESSLQLAETALVDLGVAMGPVIASIHQRREELRQSIRTAGDLDHAPRLRRLRRDEAN